MQVFDPATNVWSTAVTTDSVIPRRELGAVTLNGKFYVMGGLKKDSIFSNYSTDVQYFTPAASSVSISSALPSLTVSPNPTDGMVAVDGMPSEDYDVRVANELGENVLPLHHVSGPSASFDLSRLAPGMYFVTLRSLRSTVTERIVKR